MRALNLLRCTVVFLPVCLICLTTPTKLNSTTIPSQSPGSGSAPECPSESCHFPKNIVAYDNFFQFVGEEDSLLRGEASGIGGEFQGAGLHGQQITSRTDYSSAIGISKGQEQQIISIILDTYKQRLENKRRFREALLANEVARQHGQEAPPVSQGFLKTDSVLLYKVWVQLKEALGEEAFKKLDTYVTHEFSLPRSPGQKSSPSDENKPFPVNVRYFFFIVHVGTEDARVKREIQEGKERVVRQNYSLAAHFPEDKELPMRNLVLEAYSRLVENNDQIAHFPIERPKAGDQASKMPPPGLVGLRQERDTIIEETRRKLQAELGEDGFQNLDAWVAKHYGSGKIIGGPSHSAATDQTR